MIRDMVKEAFNKSGIYIIRNNVNQKIYVGSTSEFKRRYYSHNGKLKSGKHNNAKLRSSVNKYGIDNFTFSILEEVSDLSILVEREQYWMDELKPFYNIYPIARKDYYLERKHNNRKDSPEDTKNKCIHCATSKLSEANVIEIIKLLNNNERPKDIAKKFNVSHRCLLDISNGASYRHLSHLINPDNVRGRSKLRDRDVLYIIRRINNGEKVKDVSKSYGVTTNCIKYIKEGKRWEKYNDLVDKELAEMV